MFEYCQVRIRNRVLSVGRLKYEALIVSLTDAILQPIVFPKLRPDNPKIEWN